MKVLAEEQAEPTQKVGVGGGTWEVPTRDPACLRNDTRGSLLVSCMGMHTCLATDVTTASSRRSESKG